MGRRTPEPTGRYYSTVSWRLRLPSLPRSRASVSLSTLIVAIGATTCTFDRTTATVRRGTPVVHAVINPLAPELVILVERSLTGRVTVVDALTDPDDPIVSGGGDPISGARATVTGTHNDSVTALEDTAIRTGGKGRGVYRILNAMPKPGRPLNAKTFFVGERYTLRIRTKEGEVVVAETVVPKVGSPFVGLLPIGINRDHDTIRVSWEPVEGATRYLVRMETPFGPYSAFTDTAHLSITATLRNIDRDGFPPVLVPGFYQMLTVAAVDQNYFDYARSSNNPFTGAGLISHVTGGTGVFGSTVPVYVQRYDVEADADEPFEGTYRQNGSTSLMRLYLESRSGDVQNISGWHSDPAEHVGVLGTLHGSQLRIALLRAQFASDTSAVLVGIAEGDSLVLAPENGAGAASVWRRVSH